MDWNIVAVFPVEIWEKIVTYCDGKTLLVLSDANKTFHDIITSLDQRRDLWKDRCFDEIPDDERIDIRFKLYPGESIWPFWDKVYKVWCKWANLSKSTCDLNKIPHSYLSIADIKVSNEMIIIADKTGFSVLNSTSSEHRRFKIGPVKHLELLLRRRRSRPENSKFIHDVLDCTIGKYHLFFDLHKMIHLRFDSHENQLLRYCFRQKKSVFAPPILEANVFDDLVLIVNETYIVQAVEPMHVISQIDYSWSGARCWFLWHAKLLFCAKNDTFDIYLNGRMKIVPFGAHPRTSAVFYFGNILFLGSVHGSLYIYRIKSEEIFSFDLDAYESKFDIDSKPIVCIDIVENDSKHSCIVVATDSEIFCVLLETFPINCENMSKIC